MTVCVSICRQYPLRTMRSFTSRDWKAVGESVAKPLLYWDVNVAGTTSLLRALDRHQCRNIVFSSSATVYGMPEHCPINESAPLSTINPYGATKLTIENILRDVSAAPITDGTPSWRVAILRYFNPIGAHESGTIGEDPNGIPNNLLPYVLQVAVGRLKQVNVFGLGLSHQRRHGRS